ncbi:hypothetical protein GEMRC1_001941 [Eukaryota sp. GEM-RC1]
MLDAFVMYPLLVNDVISSLTPAFRNEGVSEDVLHQLRERWLSKIHEHKRQQTGLDRYTLPTLPPGAVPLTLPVSRGMYGFPTNVHAVPMQNMSYLGSYQQSVSAPRDVLGMFASDSTQVDNPQTETPPTKVVKKDESSSSTFASALPADRAATRQLTKRSSESVPLPPSVTSEQLAALEPVSDDSDLSEIEDQEAPATTNVIICLYESVEKKQSKATPKYKMTLLNGLGEIEGRDVYFSRASGEGRLGGKKK